MRIENDKYDQTEILLNLKILINDCFWEIMNLHMHIISGMIYLQKTLKAKIYNAGYVTI